MVGEKNNINISEIPTCKLVEELASREAVKTDFVEPYQNFLVQVNGEKVNCFDTGAAVILQIFD